MQTSGSSLPTSYLIQTPQTIGTLEIASMMSALYDGVISRNSLASILKIERPAPSAHVTSIVVSSESASVSNARKDYAATPSVASLHFQHLPL